MIKKWIPIKNYEGFYEISNYGEVRSITRYVKNSRNPNKTKIHHGKLLAPRINNKGYIRYQLFKYGKAKEFTAHRLVATHFIINSKNLPCVCHIDDNPLNNKVDNLFWGTIRDNNQDMVKKGRHNAKGIEKKVLCVELQICFKSFKDAAKYFNVSPSNISGVINNRQKTVKGYTFIKINL